MQEITRDAFILEMLKDELDSKKKPELKKYKNIIENANLNSMSENQSRYNLFVKFTAFGCAIGNYNSFCKDEIGQYEFRELLWCPKGADKQKIDDEIDEISKRTRKINNIFLFLKTHENDDKPVSEDVKQYLEEFFFKSSLPDKKSGKRRLFLIERNKKKEIIDGNHRAGALVMSLVNGECFEKITIYLAKISII